MTFTKIEKTAIEDVLKSSLRKKFQNYKPETSSMPFHTRLLGKDRLALYSFIHSLNTNFGITIFEPVANVIAKKRFKVVKTGIKAGQYISEGAQAEIQRIIDDLVTAVNIPNKIKEVESIKHFCQEGTIRKVKPTKVDIYLEDEAGEKFLIDLKTAKPNIGNFKEFKRTLLEWVAVTLIDDPKVKVNTIIAIPYNPYEPEPYNRWTIRGMLDLDKELKVANEFWDFLGGNGSYQALLDCFEKVGIELRSEIDRYFANFKSQ